MTRPPQPPADAPRQSLAAVYLLHLVDDRTGLAVCQYLVPAQFPADDTRTPRQVCPLCQGIATGWRRS